MKTTSMIISVATLVIAAATLFVSFRMLVYMKNSDIAKSKKEERQRHKDIMAQMDCKKKQIERAELLSRISGSGIDSQQIDKLIDEYYELSRRL